MGEGTRTALLEKGRLDEESVKRAQAAAYRAALDGGIRAGLEVAIEDAETDPAAARVALAKLRGDRAALKRIEDWLGGDPARATFGLGAAIAIATRELGSAEPDLRALTPQLLHWLEGEW